MRFAAVETSTEWCGVALYRDGEIACVERRAANRHSELVLPFLQQLLREARLGAGELDAIAFGAGPGSFTGLRIACGIAQGLALARGLPVLGISTLEAMAEESGAPRVVACLDARMREVYYAALEKRAGRWHEVVPAQCVAPERMTPHITPLETDWVGCGNGFAVYGNPGMARLMPELHPTAMAVARLAAPRLAAGEGVDAAQAVPVYVREKVAFTRAELDERRP
ncbi:MAG TPA: tRNA (adenosine(37)-N6)-threonylcarbamoyltransferase complex dimerization subunit type 1 TsaB [Burkholderiales bacterium]|nr:tRNA (adenosine(37)-N6)-threonylcarbamoyltransferase complex dimerization subunit type 1 TsaB [Burkholderiales bacterium]